MTDFTRENDYHFALHLDDKLVLNFDTDEEAEYYKKNLNCGGTIRRVLRTDFDEDEAEKQEMWLEKMERPDRFSNDHLNPYYRAILNHKALSTDIKEILLNKPIGPFKYGLDVGDGWLDFENMCELQLSREVGLCAFIVKLDGSTIPLSLADEMAIMECEMDAEKEEEETDDIKVRQWEVEYKMASNEVAKREAALEWIKNMDSREFETRLLDGTLPDFEREVEDPLAWRPLERSTCDEIYSLMTEDNHRKCRYSHGYKKRHNLRIYSVEQFKRENYMEFWNEEII